MAKYFRPKIKKAKNYWLKIKRPNDTNIKIQKQVRRYRIMIKKFINAYSNKIIKK